MRILRHPIEITDYQTITLPNDGDLLSVALSRDDQNGLIDLWSLDFQYGNGRPAAIYVIGTGNPMPEELRDSANTVYRRAEAARGDGVVHDVFIPPEDPLPWRKFLGTVVTPIGLVWHVFEGPIR